MKSPDQILVVFTTGGLSIDVFLDDADARRLAWLLLNASVADGEGREDLLLARGAAVRVVTFEAREEGLRALTRPDVEKVHGSAPTDSTHPRGNDVRVLPAGTGDGDERHPV